MKKLIGVIASPQTAMVSGLNSAYIEFFRQFGDVIILDPVSDRVMTDLDLLVLPGGADVNPLRYHDKPSLFTNKPNISYEYFDTVMLPKYISVGVPIFGICRGFQTLNVHFGGKLTQDYPFPYSTKSRDELVEPVIITGNTGWTKYVHDDFIRGTRKGKAFLMTINSIHHQGVFYSDDERDNQLAGGFKVLAKSKASGNVEAFYHENLPIAGVQYHPEHIADVLSYSIITKLLKL